MDVYRITALQRDTDQSYTKTFLCYTDAWNWIHTQVNRLKRGTWTRIPWERDIPGQSFTYEATYHDTDMTLCRLLQRSEETRGILVAQCQTWAFYITGLRVY